MNYKVTFIQYNTYEVEADDDGEAEVKAYKEFYNDMVRPIAHTYYDEVEIECEDEDDRE
jgi:hypothetical protein